jgi:hypothetical protein
MSTRQAGRVRVRHGSARRGADGSAGSALAPLIASLVVGLSLVALALFGIAHALPGALR